MVFTRDVTDRAGFDRTTGLRDRGSFLDAVAADLGRATEKARPDFAVLVLDVDRFKMLAGSLAPQATSSLLSEIGMRLEGWRREEDVVARIRDAVFAILLRGIPDAASAQGVADRTQQLFETAFTTHGQQLAISVSIGIAANDRNYQHADDVLRDAEVAATRAKEKGHGKQRRAVFHTQMRMDGMQFLGTQADLVGALQREELRVFYQPIVSVRRSASGVRALMRWQHPVRARRARVVHLDRRGHRAHRAHGQIDPAGELSTSRAWQKKFNARARFTSA